MSCKPCYPDTTALRAYDASSEGGILSVTDAAPLEILDIQDGAFILWVVDGDPTAVVGVSLKQTTASFDFNGQSGNPLSPGIVYVRGDEICAVVVSASQGIRLQSKSGTLGVAMNRLPNGSACAT